MPKNKILPQNPYQAGNPITGGSGFFGRKEAMDWVQRELQHTLTSVLVIRGQRRIGKTTLLYQIRRSLPAERFLPVFFDLQGRSQQKQKVILVALADEMLRVANLTYKGKRSAAIPNTDGNANIFQREFLPYYFEQINSRKVVVLIDEFDAMQYQREAVDLMQFFSKLITEDRNLIFIIATGRDPADLSKDYSAIFKGASQRELGVLDKVSAIALVRQAEDNNTLKFRNDAVDRILNLTHSHPFFAQMLCQRLWQTAYSEENDNRDQIPEITVTDVDEAVEPAIKAGELQLSWLWDGLSPAEKIFVAALAAISEENKPIFEDEVISILSKHAERFRASTVEVDAPQYLLKRDFLEKSGETQYSFTIELLRRWVKVNRPLQTVKRELDKSSETAEGRFNLGEALSEQHRLDEAKIEFENALKDKPDHLRSLIRLGEINIKMGAFESAIQVLDKAYNLDPDEARTTYARALASHAQEKYKKGDISQALESSEKALRLSPQESGAKRIRASIWNKRGDDALQLEDFVSALEAYQIADNKEGIQTVFNLQNEERKKLRKTLQIDPRILIKIPLDSPINALSFAPDNVFLASGNEDGSVVIWGPSAGTKMRILRSHGGRVNSVCYSPKGNMLASGSSDKTIIIWDADIGRVQKKLYGHKEEVMCVAFSPRGGLLASGAADAKVILWNTIGGDIFHYLDGHSDSVSCMSFSPNGQLLASGSYDKTIVVWSMETYKPLYSITDHSDQITNVVFSPDATILATGSSDGNVILWDSISGKKIRSISNKGNIRCMSFTSDSVILGIGSSGGNAILWHVPTGAETVSLDINSEITCLNFSNVGANLIAISTVDPTLQFWGVKLV